MICSNGDEGREYFYLMQHGKIFFVILFAARFPGLSRGRNAFPCAEIFFTFAVNDNGVFTIKTKKIL
jgi:hypothetical protein